MMKRISLALAFVFGLTFTFFPLWMPQVHAQDLTTMLSKFLVDLRAGTLGVNNLITYIRVGDGTSAAPSWAYASQTGMGHYRSASSTESFANDGVSGGIPFSWSSGVFRLGSAGTVAWANATTATSASDTELTRTSAGVLKLAHSTAASTAEFQISGGNGGFMARQSLTELTTIAAAATTSTAIQIPINAIVYAVSVRVVTIIPTAATFTVTSATPAKTWNTVAVPVAANTTNAGTAGAVAFQTAAASIVITPNLTPGAATGQVRVTIYYSTVTPPTS